MKTKKWEQQQTNGPKLNHYRPSTENMIAEWDYLDERRATRQNKVDLELTHSQDELDKAHPEKGADDLHRHDPRPQDLHFCIGTVSSIENFD